MRVVPLPVSNQATDPITSGDIVDMAYDPTSQEFVARR